MRLFAELLISFSALVFLCQGFFFGDEPEWHDFKVTWGLNPFSSDYFRDLPRTESDALRDGFVKVSDCDVTAPWRGSRYVKGDDWAVVLLFDVNGYIAGIQSGLPKDFPDGYPGPGLFPPFVEDDDHYVISAYFVDPSIICTTGRTAEQFNTEGTGTDLYIQNSTVPEESFIVPKTETDAASTLWTKGKCFPAMGIHYWYDFGKDSDCKKILPVFILYNGGKLNAFGFGFFSIYPNSTRFEHPPDRVYDKFVEEVPDCLYLLPNITTMHVYFDNPLNNLCYF